MKNIKNKLSLSIVSFMLFGLVACSDGNGSYSDNIDTSNSQSTNRAVEDGTNLTTNNSNHFDKDSNDTNNSMNNQKSQDSSTMNNRPGVSPNLADPNGDAKYIY